MAYNLMSKVHSVETILGYIFQDPNICLEAIHVPGAMITGFYDRNLSQGNKRLALVGDAILRAVLMTKRYATGDSKAEMHNAWLLAGNNSHLANIARIHGLAALIVPVPGQNGAFGNRTMADTMEAVIGAVWEDSQSLTVVATVLETLTII